MSAISGIGSSAEDIRMSYMTLLVAQLQNQNPLDPMDNSQMASQLAQLSELELTESINSKFSSVLEQSEVIAGKFDTLGSKFDQVLIETQVNQAMSLIGKTISFFPPNSSEAVEMKVEAVDLVDGGVKLRTGDYHVGLGAVLSVSE